MRIDQYKGIYKEVYLLHQKYAEREMTEGDFKELRLEMIALSKKYGETKFVVDFLVTVSKELERDSDLQRKSKKA